MGVGGGWCMVHGAWRVAHGARYMVAHGARCTVHGAWWMVIVHGAWCVVHDGAWCMVQSAWCVCECGACRRVGACLPEPVDRAADAPARDNCEAQHRDTHLSMSTRRVDRRGAQLSGLGRRHVDDLERQRTVGDARVPL